MSTVTKSQYQETNIGRVGYSENPNEAKNSERTVTQQYEIADPTEIKNDELSPYKAIRTQDNENSLWGGGMVFASKDYGKVFQNFKGLKFTDDADMTANPDPEAFNCVFVGIASHNVPIRTNDNFYEPKLIAVNLDGKYELRNMGDEPITIGDECEPRLPPYSDDYQLPILAGIAKCTPEGYIEKYLRETKRTVSAEMKQEMTNFSRWLSNHKRNTFKSLDPTTIQPGQSGLVYYRYK